MGSHAHMVEASIGLLKNTLGKLLRQFPESEMSDILAHSSAVLNTLPGTGGFSPAQGVFGLTKGDVSEPSATDHALLQDPSASRSCRSLVTRGGVDVSMCDPNRSLIRHSPV